MFKKGNTVKLIQPVISGEIISKVIDGGDGETLLFLVRWTDQHGQVQERHFKEDELELIQD